ncbi:MAG: hypothetical protein HQL24_09110 [Candidatus Omnitrophica bacterium]|nr:hypothetical protein [Candidatus Omnitrophota bacterium]
MFLKWKKNNRQALTFVEMLIVVCLVSMISIAIYRCFANGLAVWQRSNASIIEEDIVIFFDKIADDLRNAYQDSVMNAEGTTQKFTFPTIVRTLADDKSPSSGEYISQMGKVQYAFEVFEGRLYRRQANYGQAFDKKFSESQCLIKGLKDVQFKYFYAKRAENAGSDSVLSALPSGVEVEIEFTDQYGPRTLKKFIDVPLGI